jgi:L-iditol 2-dehydrogenase
LNVVSNAKMKALLYYGPGRTRVEEVERPRAGIDDVVIKVRRCSICGSDVRRYFAAPSDLKLPIVMGHEFAGDIVEVGHKIPDLKAGVRVTAAPDAPCGRCVYCIEGHENLCSDLRSIGYDLPGAFAQYLRLPKGFLRFIRLLPDDLSYDAASQCEPLACAINGIERSQIRRDATTVILGAGPMGLLLLMLAKSAGAHAIVGDILEHRLRKAKDFGADLAVNVQQENIVDIVRSFTGGIGAASVINTAVSSRTNDLALGSVKKGGVVNLFGGTPSESKITLSPNVLHYSEIILTGSYGYTPRMYQQAFELIVSRKIKTETLISDTFPFDDAVDAYDFAARRNGIKVAIISD